MYFLERKKEKDKSSEKMLNLQEEMVEQGEILEQDEQMMAVANEHDYVEVPPEGGLAQVLLEQAASDSV